MVAAYLCATSVREPWVWAHARDVEAADDPQLTCPCGGRHSVARLPSLFLWRSIHWRDRQKVPVLIKMQPTAGC